MSDRLCSRCDDVGCSRCTCKHGVFLGARCAACVAAIVTAPADPPCTCDTPEPEHHLSSCSAPSDPDEDALRVGDPVLYWPGIREGEGRRGRLLSERTLLGGHTWGYYVRKHLGNGSDFIAETHIALASQA